MSTKVTLCDDRTEKVITFEDIKEGDWFIYDDKVYLKMADFELTNTHYDYPNNAIDFYGNEYGFDEDEVVEPIEEMTLTIKR